MNHERFTLLRRAYQDPVIVLSESLVLKLTARPDKNRSQVRQ